MLKANEQFRDLFHPGNIRNMENPSLKCGAQMCLRFRCLGFCFGDFKFKNGHSYLDVDKTRTLKFFYESAPTNCANWNNNRSGNGTNPQDQRNRNKNINQNQQQQYTPGQEIKIR